MIAPAIGVLMADIITESEFTYDVILDIERYKRGGEVISEPSVV